MRGVHTSVIVAGDIAVFLAFVTFGKAEHEITLGQALLRTALPFGLVWVVLYGDWRFSLEDPVGYVWFLLPQCLVA